MSNNVRLPLLATVEDSTPVPVADRSVDSLMQVGDLARESGKSIRAIHLYEELELLRPAAR